MSPNDFYRTRFPGQSWTPQTIADDVAETCRRLGWTPERVREHPAEAESEAVEIWLHLEEVAEMTGDIPVEEW